MFVDRPTLHRALRELFGTSGHLLKVWFTLKHMGLAVNGAPIPIDTANSKDSLVRLYGCGASDERFYVPFAHTTRYLSMKHDASRSIIQTTIQRWSSSGSVVTCDPTEYLDISTNESGKLTVTTARRYPFGLGNGESGFALNDGERVSVPLQAFAVWYGRETNIPENEDARVFLVENMLDELNISPEERELIFVNALLEITLSPEVLSESEIFGQCNQFLEGNEKITPRVNTEEFSEYSKRVKNMVSGLELPVWMRSAPETELQKLIDLGEKAILLFGPPRTGKTRLIDKINKRSSSDRVTIQLHDGWGYDDLIEGLKPDDNGNWAWKDGHLKKALKDKKKYIVLEEINRTSISQAMGEVFSLIEVAYRGDEHSIVLRSGDKLTIPKETQIFMTMNTIDKSTEDIDDALFGRIASLEVPPSVNSLNSMLESNGVSDEHRGKLATLFSEILEVYPLGHGYFAGVPAEAGNDGIKVYYKSRIRPVLQSYLGQLRNDDLAKIDNLVDESFR